MQWENRYVKAMSKSITNSNNGYRLFKNQYTYKSFTSNIKGNSRFRTTSQTNYAYSKYKCNFLFVKLYKRVAGLHGFLFKSVASYIVV